MNVPKYIREKMHRIALYAGMASNLDREVGLWLERNGIDVEKLAMAAAVVTKNSATVMT